MKSNELTFARLRHLLLDLGFVEKTVEGQFGPNLVFFHEPSDTLFAFRPYTGNERVAQYDVIDVRKQLDWRGLLDAEAFDNLLRKASA